MLRRGDIIGHKTVWSNGQAHYENGEETIYFAFVSLNKETSERVKDVLEREGLLCQTDLGNCLEAAHP